MYIETSWRTLLSLKLYSTLVIMLVFNKTEPYTTITLLSYNYWIRIFLINRLVSVVQLISIHDHLIWHPWIFFSSGFAKEKVFSLKTRTLNNMKCFISGMFHDIGNEKDLCPQSVVLLKKDSEIVSINMAIYEHIYNLNIYEEYHLIICL